MPKIVYVTKRFRKQSLILIATANMIIEEYQVQGFDLTLRQLYYQFVARALIPNSQKSYKRLGSVVNDARMAGLIDWDSIVDRTRFVRSNAHWGSPSEMIRSCAGQFALDKWDDQDYRPEVWIEKDALIGVVSGVCRELDVPYFSCRGYTSQSEMWKAAQRLRYAYRQGQTPVVIHLGDHDPSGTDMTRDIDDRLCTFVGSDVPVKRIALNMDQIEEYGPPPNPAKLTDTRARDYVYRFGAESWELDALDPAVMVALVRSEILSLRDDDKWAARVKQEEEAKDILRRVSDELA